jgi:hypothetical protein
MSLCPDCGGKNAVYSTPEPGSTTKLCWTCLTTRYPGFGTSENGNGRPPCEKCGTTSLERLLYEEASTKTHRVLCMKCAEPYIDAPKTDDGRVLAIESFAGIRAERTRWLWDGRIPLGAATLLVGREKLGKSTLTDELAARLSQGELDGDLHGNPVASLIVSYEDSASRTIKPRLMAAGADLALVHRLRVTRGGAPDLVSLPDDVGAISSMAREHGVRLLVIDPLSASLAGSIDSHRDHDMRRALAPLVALAEQADLAVLVVAHWNKSSGGDALSRVLGSRGLTAAVRSVLAFGVAPDADEDSAERVLAHAACNVGPQAASLVCRLEGRVIDGEDEPIPTSRLLVLGETEHRADDLLVQRGDDERTDRDVAAEWLTDELADGEWHPSRAVKARAKDDGLSERTLQRARTALGVEDRRDGFPAVSQWRLPVVPPPRGTTGADDPWHDYGNGAGEPNRGTPQSQSCQETDSGTTGADPAVERAEALAARHADLAGEQVA